MLLKTKKVTILTPHKSALVRVQFIKEYADMFRGPSKCILAFYYVLFSKMSNFQGSKELFRRIRRGRGFLSTMTKN